MVMVMPVRLPLFLRHPGSSAPAHHISGRRVVVLVCQRDAVMVMVMPVLVLLFLRHPGSIAQPTTT